MTQCRQRRQRMDKSSSECYQAACLESLGKRGPVSRSRVSSQTANVAMRFKENGVLIGQPQRL